MFPFNTEKGIVNNLVKEILKIREDVLERLETLEEQVGVELPLVTEERLQELVGSVLHNMLPFNKTVNTNAY